ncbi:MAG: hypothetical protein U9Q92_06125 [archaeon]|nr:hypothetical protein [archaeon]
MKLSFRYTPARIGNHQIFRPMIPLILRKDDRHISTVGILDSGSDFILIPKDIAEYLNLELQGDEEAEAIGGTINTKKSSIGLTVSDGKNNIYLHNIPVEVLIQESLKEVIIGRIPFFTEFDILFRENSHRIELLRARRR